MSLGFQPKSHIERGHVPPGGVMGPAPSTSVKADALVARLSTNPTNARREMHTYLLGRGKLKTLFGSSRQVRLQKLCDAVKKADLGANKVAIETALREELSEHPDVRSLDMIRNPMVDLRAGGFQSSPLQKVLFLSTGEVNPFLFAPDSGRDRGAPSALCLDLLDEIAALNALLIDTTKTPEQKAVAATSILQGVSNTQTLVGNLLDRDCSLKSFFERYESIDMSLDRGADPGRDAYSILLEGYEAADPAGYAASFPAGILVDMSVVPDETITDICQRLVTFSETQKAAGHGDGWSSKSLRNAVLMFQVPSERARYDLYCRDRDAGSAVTSEKKADPAIQRDINPMGWRYSFLLIECQKLGASLV